MFSKKVALPVSAFLLLLLGGTYFGVFGGWRQTALELVYYDVSRSDLPIVITERGFLESQEQTAIRCQVEVYDYRSGSRGTSILSIVPNGSLVEEGDLLVELDSASIRDLLESESLELQSDRSVLEQAEARRTNQLTKNETSSAEAKLALELAALNREMYIDEESGSFKLAESEIERQIDEARNSILEAQAALKLQETEKDGIEQLFRLGYKGKSDLEQSRYAFMKSEAALASAINQLETYDATKKQLKTYTYEMEVLRLEGEVATAKRNMKQVEVTNRSELAQVESQVFESKERVARQSARVAQYQRNLERCEVYAPHDGMVVYANDERGSSNIKAGAEVRNRQVLLTLPDLSKMQVKIQIHEAVLDQVRPGLPVSIRVEAFPNDNFEGIVKEVAVVPSSNRSSVKTYDCTVEIPEKVYRLKPGMNAVAEINVERVRDVLSLPVQAIVQRDKDTWCYVDDGSGPERRMVQLGRNNDKFVEVVSGIEENDRVVLNPMAIASLESEGEREISPDADAAEEDLETSEPKLTVSVPAISNPSESKLPPAAEQQADTIGAKNRRRNS
ncbi:MAG: efflux RND transporter periplasmic adaptor subunit [Pirellulaceae bacterium]